MVELMIVVGLIGILASIAIPNYQKFTARSHRAEMITAIGKFKFFFKNAFDNNGTFIPTGILTPTFTSDVNPNPASAPLGQPAVWDATRNGWTDIPFGLEGAIRMRYLYKVNLPDQIEFEACASLPAFGPNTVTCGDMGIAGNYYYDDILEGSGATPTGYPLEFPPVF